MKQIKTVIQPIEQTKMFDTAVNQLLIDGWQLKKRKVINISGEPNEVGSFAVVKMLYAELEK